MPHRLTSFNFQTTLTPYAASAIHLSTTPRTNLPLIHLHPLPQIPLSKNTALPKPLKELDLPILRIRPFRLLPERLIIRLRHLLRHEPVQILTPDFDEAEFAGLLGVLEDVEEEAFGFFGAGGPDGAVGGEPVWYLWGGR